MGGAGRLKIRDPIGKVQEFRFGYPGLFLGAVLGIPQWLVLRRVVKGAWLWIPANCLAWALGMPVIFAMVDRAYAVYAAGSIAGAVVVLAGTLALTGAVVGAVHGLALVKLVSRSRLASESGSW